MTLKRNPLGLPVDELISETERAIARPTLVRVGETGVHIHIYDPNHEVKQQGLVVAVGAPICESGYRSKKNRTERNIPEIYASGVRERGGAAAREAHYVTCYRCIKLARMNLRRFGSFIRAKQ